MKTYIDMKTKLKIINDDLNNGIINEQEARILIMDKIFGVIPSSSDKKKNLNDFILRALNISKNKRKLPLIIQCPNEMEVFPSIKMKFENYGSPLLGDKLEAMIITWQD